MSLTVIGTMLLWSGSLAAKPAKEGAFLTDYAESVAQILSQVEGNRLTALRYAKHFGTEPTTVLLHFRNELSLITLPEAVEVDMYSIGPSRTIVSDRVVLKAGIKVFADRSGMPLLEFGSGNPLSSSLSPARTLPKADPAPQSPERLVPAEAKQPATPGQELKPVTTAAEQPVAVTTTSELTPIADTVIQPVQPSVLEPVAPGSPPPSVPAKSGLASWGLPAAGVAGLVAALAMSGGGDSPGLPPNPPPRYDDDPPVIPEPIGATVLGSGMLTLTWYIRRRLRR